MHEIIQRQGQLGGMEFSHALFNQSLSDLTLSLLSTHIISYIYTSIIWPILANHHFSLDLSYIGINQNAFTKGNTTNGLYYYHLVYINNFYNIIIIIIRVSNYLYMYFTFLYNHDNHNLITQPKSSSVDDNTQSSTLICTREWYSI
jgi:hypothetical protein